MKLKKDSIQEFDIPIAKRIYLQNNNSDNLKKFFLISPFFLLLFSYTGLKFITNFKSVISNDNLAQLKKIDDRRILGHLPYDDISEEKLVEIEPNIEVHVDMREDLLRMKDEAKKEGVYLVFLSGYRSINLQNEIFYSLKSLRNQVASQRARVSAPPGYSEHSTGFAIDIGDAMNRDTDFEIEFENTNAFKWLKINAAKYHFKISFDKNNTYIDYEPWHWRYEGSVEALKVFEISNRG